MKIPPGGLHRILAPAVFAITLLATGPTASQEAYTFTYGWSVGQKFNYSTYVIGQVTTNEGTSDIRFQYSDLWEVTMEDKVHNLFKVVETSENLSGAAFDLRSFGVVASGEHLERMIDVYGRVASVVHYTEGSRYFLLPLVFPQVPVRVEGKWKLTQDCLSPLFDREVPVKIVIVYTFEELNKNYKGRGRDCVRIRVDANYSFQATERKEGVTGAFQGKIVFDLVQKRLVDLQITENRREWSDTRNRVTSLQVTTIAHE